MFQIKNRFTAAVIFECELGAALETAHDSFKLGAAVNLAVKARAYLARADLTGANLARADLTGAYLARADLTGANLAGADLTGANLARADLTGANLAGADLTRADLAGADLTGANLARAAEIIPAGYPNGWFAFGWRHKGVLMVRVGCRSIALAEGRAYWTGKPDRTEVMAALDYIEVVAKLRGWPDAAAVQVAA